MDKFLIKGPAKLSGSVEISGSKNAALPIMVACIAYPGIYTLNNVPSLRDTRTIIKLAKEKGFWNRKMSSKTDTQNYSTINTFTRSS